MRLNIYFTIMLSICFFGVTYAQLSPTDSFFPSTVGNTWVYDTPSGLDTMKITKDSVDGEKNRYIFYNSESVPTYKIDSSGENIYYIKNGLNQIKYQLNTDSASTWIENSDSPVTAAKVNGVYPYYIFGQPRDVKQIGYYTIPGDTSLFDDFSHGINSAWIISSGTFSVDNFIPNPLSENQYSLSCNESGVIGISCSQAYGTWQFDIYKGFDENNLEVDFIADRIDNANYQNGYYIANNSSEGIGLVRSSIGSVKEILNSANNFTAKEATWYRITITRDTTGEFYVYINGGKFTSRTLVSVIGGYGTNPTVDTSYTASNYFVLDMDAGDRISNIICEFNKDNLEINEGIILNTNRDFENSTGNWTTIGNHTIEQSSIYKHSGSYGARIINNDLINNVGNMEREPSAYWRGGGDDISTTNTDTVFEGNQSIKVTYKGTAGLLFGIGSSNYFTPVTNTPYILSGYIFVPLTWSGETSISLNVNQTSDYTKYVNQWNSKEGIKGEWMYLKSIISNLTSRPEVFRVQITSGNAINNQYILLDNLHVAQIGNASTNNIALPSKSYVDLVNGDYYTYQMWYKSPYLNGDTLTVNIGDKSKTIASSDTWTKLTWNFQADDGTINQPIKIYLNQADTIYIDDVSLELANNTLFDKAVYKSEIWLADSIGEYYEFSNEKGALRTLKSCIINGRMLTSVKENRTAELNSFKLYQNYPNPFNPVTNINYTIPVRTKVELNIYDILGRKVAGLLNESQSAGFHSVKFNAGNLPSGIYIYRIVAGEYIESKKLVILK